jgi:hypothetical protein
MTTEFIQLHIRYTQLASDVWRSNVSFADYISLASLIRQSEFSMLQITSVGRTEHGSPNSITYYVIRQIAHCYIKT